MTCNYSLLRAPPTVNSQQPCLPPSSMLLHMLAQASAGRSQVAPHYQQKQPRVQPTAATAANSWAFKHLCRNVHQVTVGMYEVVFAVR